MPELIKDILALIVTPAVLVALGAYMLRQFFEQALKRDIESYKANLSKENDLAKARLETELKAQLFEHQSRFSHLSQKQAEVIGETFSLLVDAEEALKVIAEEEVYSEGYNEAVERVKAFTTFSCKNEIYFSDPIIEGVKNIRKAFFGSVNRMNIGKQAGGEWELECMQKALEIAFIEIPKLKAELRGLFRTYISASRPGDA
ncbi:hypothetical protein GQ464_005865 [Rhodocaloribacter litoris]|uniref:hypothetical protein n=1 Tax=Rhodocaloribacter litoris TaxID=2558931 RepID=UPI00141ED7C3|nr:hypothetical protein [Rhodocaloribacter litoris]QXD16474.1 hypothetical protein GQ464_005865 [Rhodocaloribacter litoris]